MQACRPTGVGAGTVAVVVEGIALHPEVGGPLGPGRSTGELWAAAASRTGQGGQP